MNVDLEDIRAMAARCPNMRINTLLHHLEKRQKVEELKQAQYRHMTGKSDLQEAIQNWEPGRETTFWSAFNRLMGRNG